MRRYFLLMFTVLVLGLSTAAYAAVQPGEMLADPKLEARAEAIGKQLRCPVCQNQSINDSDADLAHDLRLLVRQRLEKGDTDAQVKQYIVARYGNFVLLDPPFIKSTFALWLGPLFLLLFALLVARSFYRAKGAAAEPLSDKEQKRLDALLREKNSGDKK